MHTHGHPLSPGQTAIWFAQQAAPHSAEFQCAELLHFPQPIDTQLWERNLRECLRECRTFNATFKPDEDTGEPRLYLPSSEADDAWHIHYGRLDTTDREEILTWARRTAAHRTAADPELSGADLVEHYLMELPDGSQLWLARFHHIVCDGFAIFGLLQWIAQRYTALQQGKELPAAPFTLPFAVDTEAGAGDESDAEAGTGAEAGARKKIDAAAGQEPAPEVVDFWKNQPLSPNPPALLPRNQQHSEAAEEEFTSISASAAVTSATRRNLRKVAKNARATEFDLLTAVVALYTSAQRNADDITLGIPLMNRPLGSRTFAFDSTVSVLPLPVDLSGTTRNTPFSEYLGSVTGTLRQLRGHANIRLEELRRACGITDPTARAAGPNVNIRPFLPRFNFGDIPVDLTTISVGPVPDVEFIFQSNPDGSAELFAMARGTAEDMEALQQHVQRITAALEAIAASENPTVADVPLLLPAERQQVLVDFNRTAHQLDTPEGSTLTSLLRENYLRYSSAAGQDGPEDTDTADAAALWWREETATRRELWDQVGQVAAALHQLGAAPGTTVAVELSRTPAFLIGVAAAALCGAAWAPIDPELPDARRADMLERSGATFRLYGKDEWRPAAGTISTPEDTTTVEPTSTAPDPASTAPPTTGHGNTEDTTAAPPYPAPSAAQLSQWDLPHPADTAYVLFTSGSTGKPKAVAVPHGGIVNRLAWMTEDYGLLEGGVVLHKTPSTFDVSVWEYVLPWTHSVGAVVLPPGEHVDPFAIYEHLRRHRVTFCHFVPSMLHAFINAAPWLEDDALGAANDADAGAGADADAGGADAGAGGADTVSTDPLPDLRVVFASGEALGAELAQQTRTELQVTLANLYGPAEAAIDVTAHTVRDGETTIPIGAPVWNTQTYVLDRWDNPVPVGCPGRLFLSGVQLANGYLGQPELTERTFRRVELGLEPGARAEADAQAEAPAQASATPRAEAPSAPRCYDTGDIASWLPNGELLYHGRSDFQVKIRGQRIELGEITATITALDEVRQAAVVVREHAGESMLVAYVQPAATASTGANAATAGTGAADVCAQVRAHCRAQLPAFMVPQVVMELREFPVTTNGKLDTKSLPAPIFGNDATASPSDAPSSGAAAGGAADAAAGSAGSVGSGAAAALAGSSGESAAVSDELALVFDAFSEVLGEPVRNPESNFFELGGTSLSAISLAQLLSRRTGCPLRVSHVFAHPTPQELAEAVCSRAGSFGGDPDAAFAPLLVLRAHRSGVPVVCFFPAGGLGWSYAGLVPRLSDTDRGVWCVQAEGIVDPQQRSATLHEAAESAVRNIRDQLAAQRDKPQTVDLVGWSVGGVLAHEAARLLEESGVQVRRLALLDAYPAEVWKELPEPSEEEKLLGVLTMAGLNPDELRVELGASASGGTDDAEAAGAAGSDGRPGASASGGTLTAHAVSEVLRRRGGLFAELPERLVAGITTLVGHNAALMRAHDSVRWKGSAQLFQALVPIDGSEIHSHISDPAAWEPWLADLVVEGLRTNHPGMMSPQSLARVAEYLA